MERGAIQEMIMSIREGHPDVALMNEYVTDEGGRRRRRAMILLDRFANAYPQAIRQLSICDDCEYITYTEDTYDAAGNIICALCYESSYGACDHCGDIHHIDNMSDRTCESCMESESESGLMEYSTNVLDLRRGFLIGNGEKIKSEKSTLYMGIELEMHAKRDFYDAIESIKYHCGEWCILKEDGSLDSDGLEMVTVPMTLAAHREHWPRFFEKCAHHCEAWIHDDCGIHIHVAKSALSPLAQGRLLVFFHEPDNQRFISRVAGRSQNDYCKRGQDGRKKIPAYRREYQFGRYQGLNFATRGQQTIEFRIFKSNIAPGAFNRYLDFTHALCLWAGEASNQNLTSAAFVAWLAGRPGQYPALHAFLNPRTKEVPKCA